MPQLINDLFRGFDHDCYYVIVVLWFLLHLHQQSNMTRNADTPMRLHVLTIT